MIEKRSRIPLVKVRWNSRRGPELTWEREDSEFALIALIPSGIVEADFDPKGDIRFIENLMYDNSFPRPTKTLKDDSETVIDSNNDYSSSDNDSLYSDSTSIMLRHPPLILIILLTIRMDDISS
ncbi:hypothetical protein Tco_0687288 [Tanacetum coccineum]